MTYTLRMTMRDGTIRQTEVTTGQLLDYNAGLGLPPHFVRDDEILVDDDGTITTTDNAVPQQLDDAA